MQKFKKCLHLFCLTFAIMSASTTVSADVNDNAKAQTPYKIAIDASYPPFSYKDTSGKFVGIEIDLLAEIAKRQDFTYKLIVMNFDGVIPGIISGQLDGALDGINMSEERKKVVDFSDPYFKSNLCVVMRKDDNRVKSLDDIYNLNAGIKRGTYGMEFAEKNKDKYNLHLKYFTMTTDVVQSVKAGTSDFYMEDYPVISYAIKNGLEKDLKIAVRDIYGNPQYGFAVKKGHNKELLDKFNKGLKELQDDGTYQKILDKYI